jgi:kumamolisin
LSPRLSFNASANLTRNRRRSLLGTAAGAAVMFLFLLATMVVPAAARSVPFASSNIRTLASASQPFSPAYTPDELETAYDVTPLHTAGIDGTGQTIALIEFDRFDPSDIQAFDAANNLPDPTLQTSYIGGSSFHLPSAGEATMDIEWAHALAPGAGLRVYFLRNSQVSAAGWQAVAQAVNTAVSNGANIISLSFGACRASKGYTAASKAFASALERGVTVFASSGDDGAYPGPVRECGNKAGVSYPASDPSVVAVGGTSLVLNFNNTISDEVAWRLSGGGKGKPLLRPSWQVMATLGHGKFRYDPDVAFLGDPSTGVQVFYKGQTVTAGGTSLGAPVWAGIWALVRQDAAQAGKSLAPTPQLIYQLGNSAQYDLAFHDITTGSNGVYQAGPGWDPVTGWGTPNVAGLVSAVVGPLPAATATPTTTTP